MMFDWNDQDQVGDTLWPDLTESEDHIVPYSMETRVDMLLPAGDYKKSKRDDSVASMMSSEQFSQATHGHHCFKSEGSSGFHTNEELSSSRTKMDSLFDILNSSIELKDEFIDENCHRAMIELMNDITDGTNLNTMTGDLVQLDHEPNLFGHEDKENNDFLDCDWATFGDFDAIEKLFRKNDSIFGHDMIGADGILSPSKDVIESTAQAIPIPDPPLCKDPSSDEGCSSFQLDNHFEKQISPTKKEKVDEQPQYKAEERRTSRLSDNIQDGGNQNQHMPTANVQSSVTTPFQTIQSTVVSHQMEFGDAKLMEHYESFNHVPFQHGYSTHYYTGTQLPPHLQTVKKQKKPVPSNHKAGSDGTNQRAPDAKATAMISHEKVAMTHEKVEKLRLLQQMQAQLAIEQQQQQYNQTAGANITQSFSQNNQTLDAMTSIVTTDDARKVPSLELKMAEEQDESKITSGLTYDPTEEETIYYQLQDAIGKLDMRVRLLIRDSLFRLARSAIQRQSTSDRVSTNTSSKDDDEISAAESRYHDKSTRLAGSETDTNPIDRVVANLLFQRPTEAGPRLGSSELLSTT